MRIKSPFVVLAVLTLLALGVPSRVALLPGSEALQRAIKTADRLLNDQNSDGAFKLSMNYLNGDYQEANRSYSQGNFSKSIELAEEVEKAALEAKKLARRITLLIARPAGIIPLLLVGFAAVRRRSSKRDRKAIEEAVLRTLRELTGKKRGVKVGNVVDLIEKRSGGRREEILRVIMEMKERGVIRAVEGIASTRPPHEDTARYPREIAELEQKVDKIVNLIRERAGARKTTKSNS